MEKETDPFSGSTWHDDRGVEVMNVSQARRIVAHEKKKAWSEGMRHGSSRAMRKMSDEPKLPLASEEDNPY